MHNCVTCTCIPANMQTCMSIDTFLNLHYLLLVFLRPPRWTMYMRVHACAYVYTYVHTCIPTHPHIFTQSTNTHYSHTCMHTYNTCTHVTWIHAYIHE